MDYWCYQERVWASYHWTGFDEKEEFHLMVPSVSAHLPFLHIVMGQEDPH